MVDLSKMTKKAITEQLSVCSDLMELFAKANELKVHGANPLYVNSVLNDCRKRLVNKTKKINVLQQTTVPIISEDRIGYFAVIPNNIRQAKVVFDGKTFFI